MTKRIVAALLAVASVLAGCVFNRADHSNDKRMVKPDNPQPSPSGQYTAYAEWGPDENTVKTWMVVIRDKSGNEVFHDDYAYSTRHGVMITWLSTEPNQLWIYSGDVAVSRVSPNPSGTWEKVPVRRQEVPSEISELWRHPSRT